MRWVPLLIALALLGIPVPAVAGERWQPSPTTESWQWQLQGELDLRIDASVYDIDGFEASRADVRALHRRGRKAVCYLDVGSWETYRPDAARFPRSVIGRRYDGFPDELGTRKQRARPSSPPSTSLRPASSAPPRRHSSSARSASPTTSSPGPGSRARRCAHGRA